MNATPKRSKNPELGSKVLTWSLLAPMLLGAYAIFAARAFISFGVCLLMVLAHIGAYAGWAFDDLDDDEAERTLLRELIPICFALPVFFVVGIYLFDSSGAWPASADVAARSSWSIFVAIAFVALARRMWRSPSPSVQMTRTVFWICRVVLLAYLCAALVAPWTLHGARILLWVTGGLLLLILVFSRCFPQTGASQR